MKIGGNFPKVQRELLLSSEGTSLKFGANFPEVQMELQPSLKFGGNFA